MGTEATEEAFSITTIMVFLMSIVFEKIATRLIGAIMSLQIVIHLGLFNIGMPANSLNFIQKLKPLVGFNLLKSVQKLTFKLFPDDEQLQMKMINLIKPKMRQLGINSLNSIFLMQNLFYVQLLIIFRFLQAIILKVMGRKEKLESITKQLLFG